MKERLLLCDDSWDVIVAGGGPTGCAAAIAAAREGAKTLLIEATGSLGGMGTSGLVPTWCPFSDKEKIIYRGIAQRILEACKARSPHIPEGKLDWVEINPEQLKLIYDEMVSEAGVKVLFNTQLCAVENSDESTVSAIIVSNKAGLTAYRAKVYVDCTGDADLAAWAGAEFQKGSETGELQPATHCFTLGNVDEYAYLNGENLHTSNPRSPVHKIVADKYFPLVDDAHMCSSLIAPKTVGFNAGHLQNVDNTDPHSVSAALMKGRKMAAEFCAGLAFYHPKAFANAFVAQTAPLMGIRETRRIVGAYTLTRDDYLARRTFPDEVCRNSYYLDVHLSPLEKEKMEKGELDQAARALRYGKGESHGISYRCLTPRGLKNVLVAGRSISCDRKVHGSVRVMLNCLTTGEAAGVAAALATRMVSPDVHEICVDELRDKLKQYGAYFL